MCNKCKNNHTELFKNHHHTYNLDININDIFTGMCKEKNHSKLDYFCKTHTLKALKKMLITKYHIDYNMIISSKNP